MHCAAHWVLLKAGSQKIPVPPSQCFRVGPCTLVQRSAIKRWTQARLGEHDQMQQRRKHEQLTAHEPTTAAYTGRQQCIQRVTSFRAFGSLCWSSLQNAKVVLAFYRLLQPP